MQTCRLSVDQLARIGYSNMLKHLCNNLKQIEMYVNSAFHKTLAFCSSTSFETLFPGTNTSLVRRCECETYSFLVSLTRRHYSQKGAQSVSVLFPSALLPGLLWNILLINN